MPDIVARTTAWPRLLLGGTQVEVAYGSWRVGVAGGLGDGLLLLAAFNYSLGISYEQPAHQRYMSGLYRVLQLPDDGLESQGVLRWLSRL